MAWINPSEMLQPWLRPSTDFGGALLPGFMSDATNRAKLTEDTRQFDVAEPLRIAQTARESEAARKLKAANDLWVQMQGGQPLQGETEGLYGIGRDEMAREVMGLPQRAMHKVFNPDSNLSTWEYASPGQVASEGPEGWHDLPAHWVKGAKQPARRVPSAQYNAEVAKLQALPGVSFEEPMENKINEKTALYDALRERKLQDAENIVRTRAAAKGVDVSKLPADVKMKYDVLKASTRMALEALYAAETDLNAMSTKSQTILSGFATQAEALISQIPTNRVERPPAPSPGVASGQAEGQPGIYPGAPPAQAPMVGPAGAPVVPVKPSEDQIYQAIKGIPDTAQALQVLVTQYGMTKEQAVQFLRKYFKRSK